MTRPRRGLVLGAGGVLGAAWTIGALCALEEVEGLDVRDVDVVIGTSAGSVLAAMIAAGWSAQALRNHHEGLPLPAQTPPIVWDHDSGTGGALPPTPRPGIGSTSLLRHVSHDPFRFPPLAVLSALLPEGRASLDPIRRAIASLSPGDPDAWSGHGGLRVVAMDFDTGRRVSFGGPAAPSVPLADAVTASCAIPGWYAPIEIGGHRYVDGGACSATSVDLCAGHDLDEVYVLAPMGSFLLDDPASLAARVERQVRRQVTRRMLREAARVEADGARLTLLAPGPADLEAIGANLMDPVRRGRVLSTSLKTSAAALRHPAPDDLGVAI